MLGKLCSPGCQHCVCDVYTVKVAKAKHTGHGLLHGAKLLVYAYSAHAYAVK